MPPLKKLSKKVFPSLRERSEQNLPHSKKRKVLKILKKREQDAQVCFDTRTHTKEFFLKKKENKEKDE